MQICHLFSSTTRGSKSIEVYVVQLFITFQLRIQPQILSRGVHAKMAGHVEEPVSLPIHTSNFISPSNNKKSCMYLPEWIDEMGWIILQVDTPILVHSTKVTFYRQRPCSHFSLEHVSITLKVLSLSADHLTSLPDSFASQLAGIGLLKEFTTHSPPKTSWHPITGISVKI